MFITYFTMQYLIKPTLNRRYNDVKSAIKSHISVDKLHQLNDIKETAQQFNQQINDIKDEIDNQINTLPEVQQNYDQTVIQQSQQQIEQIPIQILKPDYQLQIQQLQIQFDYMMENYNQKLQQFNQKRQQYNTLSQQKQIQILKQTRQLEYLSIKLNTIQFVSLLTPKQLLEQKQYIIINCQQEQIKIQLDQQTQLAVDKKNNMYNYTIFLDECLIVPYNYQTQVEFQNSTSSTELNIYVDQLKIIENSCVYIQQDTEIQIFDFTGRKVILDDQQIDNNQIYIYNVNVEVFGSDNQKQIQQVLQYEQIRVLNNKIQQQNQLISEKIMKNNIQIKDFQSQTEDIKMSQNTIKKQGLIYDQENNQYYREIGEQVQQNEKENRKISQLIQKVNKSSGIQNNFTVQPLEHKIQFNKITLQNIQHIDEIRDIKLLYQQQQYQLKGGLVLVNSFEIDQQIIININSYILDDFMIVINNNLCISFPPNFILAGDKFNQSTIDQNEDIVIQVQGVVIPKIQNTQNYIIFDEKQVDNKYDQEQINNATYLVDGLIQKENKQNQLIQQQTEMKTNIVQVQETNQKLLDEISQQKQILQQLQTQFKKQDQSQQQLQEKQDQIIQQQIELQQKNEQLQEKQQQVEQKINNDINKDDKQKQNTEEQQNIEQQAQNVEQDNKLEKQQNIDKKQQEQYQQKQTVNDKLNIFNQALDDVLQSSDSANVSIGFSPILLQKLKQQIQLSSESSDEDDIKINSQTSQKIDELTKNKQWLKEQAKKIYSDIEQSNE